MEVKSGNTVLNYEYGDGRRKTAVYLNGELYESYSYSDGTDYDLVTASDISGNSCITETDKQGNVLSITYNNETLVTCEYDIKGKLISRSDKITQADAHYTYDKYDNLTVYTCGANTENYTYNAYGQVTEKKLSGAVSHTYNYGYKDNAAKSLDYITVGSYTFKPLTDVNGRNTGKEIFNGESKIAGEYISYRKVGDHATNMPSAVWYGNGTAIKDSIKYTYDKCGNICEIKENGALSARYKYDALNRLVREDNKKFGKTYLFEYDGTGNITARRGTEFTLKTNVGECDFETFEYGYDGDRLVSYNGELCEYNGLGSPTKYRGKPTTWRCGKVLLSYNGTSFTYDALNRRTGKGNIQFVYDNDGNLIRQSNGLEFIYDHSGVTGLKYNGCQYFYRKDVQGNITAILDSIGDIVVRYNYDAWGNHTIEGYKQLGAVNPFRYRGYYYDTETNLYYLQTRYYDPETGRFISQDSIEYADPESINGLNLYAYCLNNPITFIDETGCSVFLTMLILGIIGGAILGGTVNGIKAYNDGQRGLGLFGAIAGGAIMGGAMGAVFCLGGAAGLSVAIAPLGIEIIGFGLSTAAALGISLAIGVGAGLASYSVENCLRSDREWSVGGFIRAGTSGAVKSIATFWMGYMAGKSGAFDKMILKNALKNFKTLNKGITYDIAKSLLSEAIPSLGRTIFNNISVYLGETLTRILLFGTVAGGIRTIIDLF